MKSVPEKTWVYLRNRPVESTVKHSTIVNQIMRGKGVTEKAVDLAIRRMVRDGALLHTNIRGMYEITPSMLSWGDKVNFRSGKKGKKGHKKAKKADVVSTDNVIMNLLNAMAEAENELRRLMSVDRKAKELARKCG
jgi:DNA-binding transcriptional regulator PaaX